MKPGEMFSVQMGGGGGYGPTGEREAERVRSDVKLGKISAERATEVYGVHIETAPASTRAED